MGQSISRGIACEADTFFYRVPYRTVVGKDGRVSREFRFRSTSKDSQDDAKHHFQRQTSEPVKNYNELDPISEDLQRDLQKQQSNPANIDIVIPEPKEDKDIFSSTESPQSEDHPERTSPEPFKDLNEREFSSRNISRKKSEKILEDISNLVLREAESLTEELSTLSTITDDHSGTDSSFGPAYSVTDNNEREKSEEKNLLPEPFKENNVTYQSVYEIEAEVLKEEDEKLADDRETDGKISAKVKSSLDSELPSNSFYQTSVPEPVSQPGPSDNSSMLDFCISRTKSQPEPDRAKSVYKFQPQVRKPSLMKNRKKSYKRSKSYAGGTVSLSQCPLCARLFERSDRSSPLLIYNV